MLLGGFWLVLSGHFTPLFFALGALSVAVVGWLTHRADLRVREGSAFSFTLRLLWYLPWLVKEIVVSAVAVVRKVWSPRPALRPGVEATPSAGLPVLSQVVYANSITLTPGTLSIHLDDEHIDVHSLDTASLEDLHSGRMLRQVRRLEVRR